jgi:hypothetical protein
MKGVFVDHRPLSSSPRRSADGPVPSAAVLGNLGVALGFGLLDGRNGVLLTLLPGFLALVAITLVWYVPRLAHQRGAALADSPGADSL